ncbi:MAG: SDR family NAD(P)-dependent oxidoreductase, partial [Rhodococcus ruber]|nr:SDR family NAD(P)-dependent oxidoreductase [Rhodococcus ruber]
MIDVKQYGPWAVIAGGSEGVGSAFADELSKAGLNLVLIARKPGPLEETAEKVRGNGVEVRTLALDLLADDAVEQLRR